MKTEVTYEQPVVRLELTVDEYRLLNGMRYSHLAGTSDLRKAIEAGFHEVDGQLGTAPDYRRNRAGKTTAEAYLSLSDPPRRA